MPKYSKVKKLISKTEDFKRIVGVKPKTFELMVKEVRLTKAGKGRKTGRTNKSGIEDQVLMMLEYYREYRTYAHIGIDFDVSESTVQRTVFRVENILIKSGKFSLPKKSKLISDTVIEAVVVVVVVVVVDASESPRERPKKSKKQKQSYSGKKKRNTNKFQLLVDLTTKRILRTNFCNGKKHDFQLFKDSNTILFLNSNTEVLGDSGYQGIQEFHGNSTTPIKKPRKSKNNPNPKLTKDQKKHNRELASKRITGEHVIREVKIFKIIQERYRNRGKRFSLRVNLISGIRNFELGD